MEKEALLRAALKDKKRIVVKIGSSSLHHAETGRLDLTKIEHLVRELCDLRNRGKDVTLVSSGAIAVGRVALGMEKRPETVCEKQACASIGQARLMMTYQKIFSEYNQIAGQVLMTKYSVLNPEARKNAHNTFEELYRMGIVPIVNENDTISTYEIHFGDNDSLSALVCAITGADLLILLSDIDGLFTDDPNANPDAKMLTFVDGEDAEIREMAKDSSSDVGTGGMKTKLDAAHIANACGCDMIIANGKDVRVIHSIMEGDAVGTFFAAKEDPDFKIEDYIFDTMQGDADKQFFEKEKFPSTRF